MRDLTKSYFESQQDIIAPSDIDIVNNEMFESIQVLFDAWAAKLPKPDLTIECKIVNNDKALNHWYTVITNNNQQLEVQGENVEYKVGEKVLVVIPEGDYSKRKRIIGRYYDEIDTKDEDSSNQDYYFEVRQSGPSETYNFTVKHKSTVQSTQLKFDNILPQWDIDSIRLTLTLSGVVNKGSYWLSVTTTEQEVESIVCTYNQWVGNYNNYDKTTIYDYIILPNQKYYSNLDIKFCTSEDFDGIINISKISGALCHSQKEPIYLYKEGDFDTLDTIHTDLNFIKTQLWLSAIAPFNYITGTVSGNILDANQGYMAHLPVQQDSILLDANEQLDTQQDVNIRLINSTLKHAVDLNIIKDSNFNNLRWLTMHPMNEISSTEGYGIAIDLGGEDMNPNMFYTIIKWEQPYDALLYRNGVEIAALRSSKESPSYYYLQERIPADTKRLYLSTLNKYKIDQMPFPSEVRMKISMTLNARWVYSTTLVAKQFPSGVLFLYDTKELKMGIRYSALVGLSLEGNVAEGSTIRPNLFGRVDMDYIYQLDRENSLSTIEGIPLPAAAWFTYQSQQSSNAVLQESCTIEEILNDGEQPPQFQISITEEMRALFLANHGTQMNTYIEKSNLMVDFTQGFSCLAPVLLRESASPPHSKLLLPPQLADKYDLTLREIDNQVHKRVEWYHLYEPANRWDLLPFEPSTIHNIEQDQDDNEIHTFDLSKRYRFLQDGYGKFKAVVYIDDQVYESNILTINPPEEEKEA